eukprot:m.12421 g.12421  ORF g.12421 m.12421 type:complete len:840 (-) comp6011_c0_seq2:224-2743(-)
MAARGTEDRAWLQQDTFRAWREANSPVQTSSPYRRENPPATSRRTQSEDLYRSVAPAQAPSPAPNRDTSYAQTLFTVTRTNGGYFAQEFEEIEHILEERLKTAEETARALVQAKDSLHTEKILQTARIDALPSRAAYTPTRLGASPTVQATVAERNDVRFQLRKALTDLERVEVAAGGRPADIVEMCHADMARLARLRADIELAMEKVHIQLEAAVQTANDANSQRDALARQTATAQEQLTEQAAALRALDDQIRQAHAAHERTAQDGTDRLRSELAEQATRQATAAAEGRDAALRELQARLAADHARDLASLEADLADRYNRLLAEQLSAQQHELAAQAAADKAAALQELQSRLQRTAEDNIEHLRAELLAERDRIVTALQRKQAATEQRAAEELASTRADAEIALQRALDEQKRNLGADATQAHVKEMRALEASLQGKAGAELEDLRAMLIRKHTDELNGTLARQLAAQKKALTDQFNRDRIVAIDRLRAELETEHGQELLRLKEELTSRYEREISVHSSRVATLERKKTMREATQDKAFNLERIQADFRAEKTAALAELRAMLEKKHALEIETLTRRLAALQREDGKLRQEAHEQASEMASRSLAETRAQGSLKERLRSLLSGMKTGLAPRMDAPLDGSASTPNLSMGNLSVLINALGDKGDAYTLPPPSAGALSAPPAAIDIVLDCGDELCEYLAAANNEIEALRHQLVRDRKLVRKQIEEEQQQMTSAQLSALRTAMLRERDMEITQQAAVTAQQQQLKERRERKEAEAGRPLTALSPYSVGTIESPSTSSLRHTQRLMPSSPDGGLAVLVNDRRIAEMERVRLERTIAAITPS